MDATDAMRNASSRNITLLVVKLTGYDLFESKSRQDGKIALPIE